MATGWLVLEDGTRFEGRLFGAVGEARGEIVCNTGVTGYQEMLTDPVFCGQIVVLSYPVVGCLGASPEDGESPRPHLRGVVVRQLAEPRINGSGPLERFLSGHGVAGLEEVDTRALVRHFRDAGGCLRGTITASPEGLTGGHEDIPDQVDQVTTPWPYRVYGDGPRVVVVDYGLRAGMLRAFTDHFDCDLIVVPAATPAADILDFRPDGVLLSSGPGDAGQLSRLAGTVQDLLGRVPLFGVGLGHHLLATALGAGTGRLPFGHRGLNHPVKEVNSGRVFITAQNHGYVLEEESLANTGLEVTYRNCHDGTVEGTRHRDLAACGVDFHPHARPGPADALKAFEQFWGVIRH